MVHLGIPGTYTLHVRLWENNNVSWKKMQYFSRNIAILYLTRNIPIFSLSQTLDTDIDAYNDIDTDTEVEVEICMYMCV